MTGSEHDERGMPSAEVGLVFPRWLPWGVVALGLLPRLAQYVHYRALFHDEAVLANNIVNRPWGELFGPFQDSMAPAGYLLLTRWAIGLGGMNEYAARLVPFLGGLISLVIFYAVAKRVVSPLGACVALTFFAVSRYVIEFGDYVRPYSTDVLVTLILFGLAQGLLAGGPGRWRYVVFAAVGGLSVWVSFPAVFVLAGLGTAQIVCALREGQKGEMARLCAVYGVCALSFLGLYFVSINPIAADVPTMALMNDYYQFANAFMPLPPRSFGDLKWFNWHFVRVFENPGGLTLAGLAAFAAVAGAVALLLNNRKSLGLLLLPVAMALLASGLERYPFWARTILYLSPIIYMLIGEGVAFLANNLKGRNAAVAVVIFVMLIGVPAFRAARIVRTPTTHHELNKVLDYAQEHWREGDVLYVPWVSAAALPFLRWRYDFQDDDFVLEPLSENIEEQEKLVEEWLAQSKPHGRIWVPITFDFQEEDHAYRDLWDRHATRTDEAHAPGASVYLYEFTVPGERGPE